MRELRAEWIRAKGSVLWWLAGGGLLLGVILSGMSLVGRIDDAADMLNWHALLVTGMLAPISVLYAGLTEQREKQTRSGGTVWRPVSDQATRAARLIVVWVALGLFFLLDFGATWALAALFGLDHAPRVLLIGFFTWVGSLGVAGLGAAVSRRWGLLVALAGALVWQFALGFLSERDWWWCNPGAWPMRLVVPAMGLHINATPLEADSPLLAESPWPAFALCVLLAAAGMACAVAMPPRTTPLRLPRRTVHAVTAPVTDNPALPAVNRPAAVPRLAALRGIHRAALNPAVIACVILSVLAMLFALRYDPSVRTGLFTYAILPVGAGLLPVLVWPQLRPAWSLMQIEHPRVRTALLGWLLIVVTLVALVAAATSGATLIDAARRLLLILLTGGAMTFISLTITARWGIGWALALTLFVTIFSVTIGGDVLAESALWIIAPTAWPETATTFIRFAIAAIVGAVIFAGSAVIAHRRLSGSPARS
ncbi:hypothetical protein M3G18_09635 [Corynebacterium sp. p3-SID1145]|uniref:hypothetical protein n=1 Tax=unclassified Corynebacterium TaxID=2624378 RepID=UPI0021A9E61B|nr:MULTISPECIES: hypothetical protein [unclassified Corynebacterium]MCT1453159.1 hypothetical protein [Corynebacterium sp. p3-SID1145]MCT1462270.1 hypothetical protein [Corynebacterium sp. p3-SID1140]